MTRLAARLVTALATAGVLTLTATGCGTGTPPPSGPTTPTASTTAASPAVPTVTTSGSASAAPAPPTTDPAIIFAADGIGPYIIGTQLSELQGRALVTGVFESQLCADSKGAAATGRYAGVISLSFTAGRLVSVHTTSDTLVTPSGAKVGMSLADAQSLYGGRGTLITSTAGASKALVVRVTATALAVVLFLDPTNTKVASMSGGEAERLESAARAGEGC
jgi:hypothetical protein